MELITYAFLRAETDISQNIPDDELRVPIIRAQDKLKGVLGIEFYEQIESQFPDSFSSDNSVLFDPYIKKFLAWQGRTFWLQHANFKTTRSGMRVHKEENSEPASDQQVFALVADARQQAAFYEGLMTGFIRKQKFTDSSKYPLFDNCKTKSDSGLGITAVRKKDNIHSRINKRIDFNG